MQVADTTQISMDTTNPPSGSTMTDKMDETSTDLPLDLKQLTVPVDALKTNKPKKQPKKVNKEYAENDDDDENFEDDRSVDDDDRSVDDDDDAGSLEDFIVKDKTDDEESNSEDNDEEVNAEQQKSRDLEDISDNNIVTGKRIRKPVKRFEEGIFNSDEYKKMVFCDIPDEELNAALESDEDEEDEEDEEDDSYDENDSSALEDDDDDDSDEDSEEDSEGSDEDSDTEHLAKKKQKKSPE